MIVDETGDGLWSEPAWSSELQTQKGRPLGAAGLRDLASQFEMVAEEHNQLYFLLRAARPSASQTGLRARLRTT
jgi:hypothetical protein